MTAHDIPHSHAHDHGHAHEHCLKMARREDGTPWWADFPEPRSAADKVEPEYVFQLLQAHELSETKSRDFLLVDARRADCTGGTVHGAMNLPAHSFYPTRKTLYDLCKQAGIRKVVFYCGESAVLTLANPGHSRADNGCLLLGRLLSRPRSSLRCLAAGLCRRGRRRPGVPSDGRWHPRLGPSIWRNHDGRL